MMIIYPPQKDSTMDSAEEKDSTTVEVYKH